MAPTSRLAFSLLLLATLAGAATAMAQPPIGKTQPSQSPEATPSERPDGGASALDSVARLIERSPESVSQEILSNPGPFLSVMPRQTLGLTRPGKIVISLSIAADGRITACKVVSNTFDDPDYEQRLKQSVSQARLSAGNFFPMIHHYEIGYAPPGTPPLWSQPHTGRGSDWLRSQQEGVRDALRRIQGAMANALEGRKDCDPYRAGTGWRNDGVLPRIEHLQTS